MLLCIKQTNYTCRFYIKTPFQIYYFLINNTISVFELFKTDCINVSPYINISITVKNSIIFLKLLFNVIGRYLGKL